MAHRALAIFRRKLFNFLTILSLLLCLTTVALWVRSYWRCDDLTYLTTSPGPVADAFVLLSNLGEFALDAQHSPGSANIDSGWSFYTRGSSSWDWPRGSGCFYFLGFGYVRGEGPEYSARAVWFPHWFLALLFAILPAIRLRGILRSRRRRRIGLCPHCGYDLRATPDRCPECGHQPELAHRLTAPRPS